MAVKRGPKPGFKQSPEHIAKRIKRGPDHPNWIGEAVSEKGGRARALRLYPTIGPCEVCGEAKAERHHADGNTANNAPTNIEPLCRRCHMAKDGRMDQAAETLRAAQPMGVKARWNKV